MLGSPICPTNGTGRVFEKDLTLMSWLSVCSPFFFEFTPEFLRYPLNQGLGLIVKIDKCGLCN